MQMLSGVITEGEYKAKLEEKESLNEHYIAGGIVGIGAITQIPSREKSDYEMAFEHFLGERYETKFENREQDLEEGKEVEVAIYQEGKKWVVSHPVANRLEQKEFDSIEDAYAYYTKAKSGNI
jgi:hypothetical protein